MSISVGTGMLYGSLISAAGSVAGGALNSGGGVVDKPSADDYRQYYQLSNANQKTVARNLPLWTVQGARKAGLHPLAALGISPASGAPALPYGGRAGGRDYGLAEAGQQIGRAVNAYATRSERKEQADMLKESARLDLERKHLENDLLLMDAMARNRDLRNPTQTSPGVPGPHDVQVVPGQQETTFPGRPSSSAAVNPSQQMIISPGGILRAVNSERIGDAVESDTMGRADILGDKIALKVKQIINGIERPKRTPHQINPAYPESWRWKKVRTMTGPAWKAVPHTRIPNPKTKARNQKYRDNRKRHTPYYDPRGRGRLHGYF